MVIVFALFFLYFFCIFREIIITWRIAELQDISVPHQDKSVFKHVQTSNTIAPDMCAVGVKGKWARAWQNQQNGICPVWSESLLCTQWVARNPSFVHADSKDWSDWTDAQANLCWVHMPFRRFYHALSQILFLFLHENICFGYSLEATQWDTARHFWEYPWHMFSWRNKKLPVCFGWKNKSTLSGAMK